MAGNLHTNYPPSQLELRSYQQLQGSLQLVFFRVLCRPTTMYHQSSLSEFSKTKLSDSGTSIIIDGLIRSFATPFFESKTKQTWNCTNASILCVAGFQLQSRQEYRCDWQDLSALQHIELQEMDSRQWRVHHT
jgi:hypothetical protein